MKLIYEATGAEVKIGEVYNDFRGHPHRLDGFLLPRHEGSTGRVVTNVGTFYPGVLGMKWVD